jgi:osmotically-inducible protein OsmY
MNKFIISTIAGAALSLLSGCQVVSGDRSINQYTSDAAVTTNVKTELLHEPRVTSLPIHVETDKGTVTLTGFVKNNEQKIAAGQAAALAKGVRIIRNDLIIRK